MKNPYDKNHSYGFQYCNWQRKFVLPVLVQPIVSALKKGYKGIAQKRFDKLFVDLGLKADYEALMLRQYVIEALNN